MVRPDPVETLRVCRSMAGGMAGIEQDSPEQPRIRAEFERTLPGDTGNPEVVVTEDTKTIVVRDLRYHRIDRLVPLAHSTGPLPAHTMPTRPQRCNPPTSPGGNRTIHGDDRITHRLPTPLELGGAE